jgi:hypothetical protein
METYETRTPADPKKHGQHRSREDVHACGIDREGRRPGCKSCQTSMHSRSLESARDQVGEVGIGGPADFLQAELLFEFVPQLFDSMKVRRG